MTARTDINPVQPVSRWSEFEPDLRLVPPGSREFGEPGFEPNDKARQWAEWHRYLRADGIPRCAHGLYLMNSCPALNGACGPLGVGLDHTSIWVPAERPYEPFILTQPCVSEVPAALRAYADAHGLAVSSTPQLGDGWHSRNALPVRLTVKDTGAATWPLGTRAVVLTAACPMDWLDIHGDHLWWRRAS